ncbi:MAG: DUF763 domain-containing protein [candidate division NC10 bacterium]|nr:DUF763 domain-containing protein [candidate division NC10 bacterium]
MRTGFAHLPLHQGKAPSWLFSLMKSLAREISVFVISYQGAQEYLRKLSDPFWFQAFGCILGFDWHSSGLTTTVCGAVKEGVKPLEAELGFFVAGGKGAISRRTPLEIEARAAHLDANPSRLIYASRMTAKVDSNALQDGYQLYHHCFFFTRRGEWAVIQQGMNEESRYARRYHWLGKGIRDFVCEPQSAICCDRQERAVFNMVASESEGSRRASAALSREKPEKLVAELRQIQSLELPSHHPIQVQDIHPQRLHDIFLKTYEHQPQNFEELLGMPGVGAKTIRALALITELLYGTPPSFRDPARYSFAHGGKDGHPYPVDRQVYVCSIDFLKKAIQSAKIGHYDKVRALKRLSRFYGKDTA